MFLYICKICKRNYFDFMIIIFINMIENILGELNIVF